MKKFLPLLLGFVLITTFIKAQYAVIPDDNFRNFLLAKYPSCFDDGTGRLNTTCSSVVSEDTLIITNLGIRDLTGIEYFINLKYLDCSHNSVDVTPTLPSALTYLNCSYALTVNSDPGGPYTILPTFPTTLTYLDCSGNGTVTNFNVPNSVTYLNCSQDGLYNLPALPNTLTYLDCSGQIDVSLEPQPLVLHSLPALPDSLKFLNCSWNAISALPALPKSLTSLICINMLSGQTSNTIPLVSTLFCLPILPASLTYLNCDTNIRCLPNLIPGLSTLPVCDPTNDVNHCQGFPVISGNVFYDGNSNNTKDGNELYAYNIRIQLSNGSHSKYVFTNSDGSYQISPDSIGNYTLTINAPSYYQANPVSINYSFSRYDTTVALQNIALQPTANVDSVQIFITPYSQARPGFDLSYLISYKNIGTTTLAPNIVFNYPAVLLTYNSSNNTSVVNNNTNLSLSGITLLPGQSDNFTAVFTVNPLAIPGEVAFTNASITANMASSTDSAATVIRGSYDPNDKEATTQLTPEQVTQGKSINYIVHFQNTGNDVAYNIVIADTLSSLLDINSLQITASSSPCKATINGNVVYFEFLNVSLPDSTTNEPASHGFINFSIKPLSSISNGTAINNTASIYFDYNAPVITNTVATSIQEPNSTVPVTLLAFTAYTQPENKNVLLYWNTANELNTKVFVIEQSIDGILFTTTATVAAKGLGTNNYSYTVTNNTATYYRLKMIDNNGQYTYSKIVAIKIAQDAEGIVILNNPVVNFVTVKNNTASLTNTEAKILDAHGAIVKHFILQAGTQNIDVSNLPSGGYYIQTQTTSLKLVIGR